MKRTAQVAVIAVAAASGLVGGLGVFLAPVTLPALWFVARGMAGAWRLVPGLVAAWIMADVAMLAVALLSGWPQAAVETEHAWRMLWPLPIVLGLACGAGYLVASARHPAGEPGEPGIHG